VLMALALLAAASRGLMAFAVGTLQEEEET
jgi:hypothetical protein